MVLDGGKPILEPLNSSLLSGVPKFYRQAQSLTYVATKQFWR